MHGGGSCRAELDRVHERIAGRFARAEPRARVRKYVSGLVGAWSARTGGRWLSMRRGEPGPACSGCCAAADWDVDGWATNVAGLRIESNWATGTAC